jgi:hypothetical protein
LAAVVLCVNLLGMPHFDCKILIPLFLIFACTNQQATDYQLVVSVEQTALRAEPNEKSLETGTLHKGTSLLDLGEVGASESQIAVGGELVQSPWIKVKNAENEVGWVLAWALEHRSKQSDWLLQKRMTTYFGNGPTLRRNKLVRVLAEAGTEEQLANTWKQSIELRDTFLLLLSRRPEAGFTPQFNWLNEAIPGFIFQKLGENERPHLFADYQFWMDKALKTKGFQDDLYFQTCLVAFPLDGIESFFPVWKFQLSETESASQLGNGQHLKMFLQIDKARALGLLFGKPLDAIREQLYDDIFDEKVRYWQPQGKILEELDQILEIQPKCVSKQTLESVIIRRRMFEDPEKNGIILNLRSGE